MRAFLELLGSRFWLTPSLRRHAGLEVVPMTHLYKRSCCREMGRTEEGAGEHADQSQSI